MKKKKKKKKRKEEKKDKISAILYFLSCSKALIAISLAWIEKDRNFLSL